MAAQQSSIVAADQGTEFARISLLLRSGLAGLRVAMPVRVTACTATGTDAPIGRVTLQPLVSAVDGSGRTWPHAPIYDVPYLRMQAGSSAIILDPVAGDIGVAVVCDRDISTVKASSGVSAPGSARKNDLSDMVYLGSILGPGTPTRYIQFNSSGITLVASNVSVPGTLEVGTGASGTFTAYSGQVVTVQHGIVTSIV